MKFSLQLYKFEICDMRLILSMHVSLSPKEASLLHDANAYKNRVRPDVVMSSNYVPRFSRLVESILPISGQ